MTTNLLRRSGRLSGSDTLAANAAAAYSRGCKPTVILPHKYVSREAATGKTAIVSEVSRLVSPLRGLNGWSVVDGVLVFSAPWAYTHGYMLSLLRSLGPNKSRAYIPARDTHWTERHRAHTHRESRPSLIKRWLAWLHAELLVIETRLQWLIWTHDLNRTLGIDRIFHPKPPINCVDG